MAESRRGSIAGVIVKDGAVFVAKRNPTGQMGGRWEFPGGKIEEGESQEDALHREFIEEFNADVTVLEPIAEAEFTHNGVARPLYAWHVAFAEPNPAFTLTEHTETAFVPVGRIADYAASGNFVDSDMLLYPAVKAFVESVLAPGTRSARTAE